MDELDQKIMAELSGTAEAAPPHPGSGGPEVNNVMELVIQQNATILRKVRWWVYAWHVFLLAALLYGAYLVIFEAGSDDRAAGLFISMAALAGFVVIKVVYYLTAARLSLETKLKELELGVAEVRELLRESKR